MQSDQLCYPLTLNQTVWFNRKVIRVAICADYLIIVNSTLLFKPEVIRWSIKPGYLIIVNSTLLFSLRSSHVVFGATGRPLP